jgi:drug/metabolite transporter (DMT)-like permease
LKQAYPFIALAFIIVPILGQFFLHEELSLNTMLGGVLILVGVCVSVL